MSDWMQEMLDAGADRRIGLIVRLPIEDMPEQPLLVRVERKPMKKSEIIRLMAEILGGLQVPGSMGVLGAAHDPWAKLMTRIDTFGWRTVDEIEKELIEALEEEFFADMIEGES